MNSIYFYYKGEPGKVRGHIRCNDLPHIGEILRSEYHGNYARPGFFRAIMEPHRVYDGLYWIHVEPCDDIPSPIAR